MIKNLLLKIAFKILSHYHVKVIEVSEPDSKLEKDIQSMVEQVQGKFKEQSGEFKRHQVLRAIMNMHPEVSGKEIAYQIEMAVKRLG